MNYLFMLAALCLAIGSRVVNHHHMHVVTFTTPIDLRQERLSSHLDSIVILNSTSIRILLNEEDVASWIGMADLKLIHPLKPVDKYASNAAIQISQHSQQEKDLGPLQIVLHISNGLKGMEEVRGFLTEIGSSGMIEQLTLSQNTVDKAIILVDQTTAAAFIDAASRLVSVHWIEERPIYRTWNRWATATCRGDVPMVEDEPVNGISLGIHNLTGRDSVVGLSDSGLDVNSCFFEDSNQEFNFDSVNSDHRKIVYYDTRFGDDTDGPEGHGTHVAGSIAGSSSAAGFQTYNGIASNAKIAFFDLGRSGMGDILNVPSDMSVIFSTLYDTGARVFSNSWGSPVKNSYHNSYTMDSRTVDLFMRQYPDSLIIFAAGNDGGHGRNTVSTPSTNKNGLAVGASITTHEGVEAVRGIGIPSSFTKHGVAYFSSIGPTQDNRLKPDILATGWMTNSAKAGVSCGLNTKEGTSMATPLIAGSAIIIREYFTEGYYPTGAPNVADGFNPSGALLKAMIIHSGKPMTHRVNQDGSKSSLNKYPSIEQGYGRVSIDKVLNFGKSEQHFLTLIVRGGAYPTDKYYVSFQITGETHRYEIALNSLPPALVRVTVAYTDIAGFPSGSITLINKLSLKVTHNYTGAVFYRLNSDWAEDNVMVIDILEPAPNDYYIVEVKAQSLVSEQPYAIVMTGNVYRGGNTRKKSDYTSRRSLSVPRVLSKILIIFLSATLIALSFSYLSYCMGQYQREELTLHSTLP